MADDHEDLACPICLDTYDLISQQPRMLLCSGAHEVCAECLEALPVTEGTISCPQCRETVRATSNPNRGLLAALKASALARQREATATAAVETAEAEAATARRQAATAQQKLARQQRTEQTAAARAAEKRERQAAKDKQAEETRKTAARAAANRKREAHARMVADAFHFIFRLLLLIAGGAVLGYFNWSYLGIWGYNLTIALALAGLGCWAAVGGRLNVVRILALASAFHVGTCVAAAGHKKRLTQLDQLAEELAADSPLTKERMMDIAMDRTPNNLLMKAADHGHVESMYKLAVNFRTSGQKALFWKYLKMAADGGDRDAQQDVGHTYDTGNHGVPVDMAASAKYLKLAADQGMHDAQAALGWKLAYGEGVPKDSKEAARYYKLALSGGRKLPNIEYGLSRMYGEGDGVEQDMKESFRLCRLAAKGRDPRAMQVCGSPGAGTFPTSWYKKD